MNTHKKIGKRIDKKMYKKNRRIFMISVIGLLLLITAILIKNDLFKETMGTRSGNFPKKDEEPFEVKLTDKITYLLSKNLNIGEDRISILNVSDIQKDKLVMFLYEDNGKNYEGLCKLSKVENSYNIIATSTKEVDKYAPFTVNVMETKVSLTENYKILGGVINDPNIKSININFDNNTMTNILIGEDKSFFYVIEENEIDILTIEALDNSLKIFYKWYSKEKVI
ncbi:hypothetical protein GCM10008908_31900 [Clostridium subterminale]|uniref:Uncharacterized protein n=1 Tax=Clostridium subterminale TaxID=1550 RepID=A0ABN1KVT1_CLOSU